MGDIPYKKWITGFLVAVFIIGVALMAAGNCERKENEEAVWWFPSQSSRIEPHTNVIPMDDHGWTRVSIDCTNDFDGTRMGHDAEKVIGSGESVEIYYRAGWCSYFDPAYHDLDDKEWGKAAPSGGWALTEGDIQAGKRIRYPNVHGGYLAVLVVLRTDSGEEHVQKFPNSKRLEITNPFEEPARLFFFFNGLEYFYNNNGEREEGFKYNGLGDNTRVVFDIYQ